MPARAGEGVVNFCNRRRRPGPCPNRLYGCRDMFARAPNHMWPRFIGFSSSKAMQTKFCEGYPLPVKARCSIDAYNGYLKCENLLNLNFWVAKIGPDALIRDPSPARAGTSRGGGCQFLQPAAAPSSVSKSTMAVGTCLLGPRATCGRASCVSLLKSSENEILRGGTPRL